jgi:C4-dicarboxylate-specific signal transduction histidine kinase
LTLGESVNLETVRIRKDGTFLQVSELAVPITVEGERISDYIIFRDITKRKQATEALERAQAELARLSRVTSMGELVASISHEVNQPIGAIVTNGDAALRFLAKRPPNLNEVQEALEWMVRDATRASAVIGRIRSLLTNNAPHMACVNVNELIRSVLLLVEAEVRRNDVLLRTEFAADLPSVLGDRVQLQQVILNLIMNSIDAMTSIKDRRELHISSSRETESVLIRVRDSGIGIDPDKIDNLFDPFFTTKPDGIGMGLSISRSIIEAHGGKLWATPGSSPGAVFQLTLPNADHSE